MKIERLHQLYLDSQGICTDTRGISQGTLFFALKGDNFNGNQYAKIALEKGSNYSIIDEPEYNISDKCILVDSVLLTLQKLANFHRKQFNIPVIAITGSNGKTTTKELIGEILDKKFNVLMTEGNLNNHLGVPFTLLNLTSKHEIAVVEMGANKPGDIKELVDITEPTHGIITNVGTAHIEGFGSLEGVIKTKTELYDYIGENNGILFFNEPDLVLKKRLPNVKLITYGGGNSLVKGKLEGLTPFVNLKWSVKGYSSPVLETNLVGQYNFINFLTAVAVGVEFSVDPKDISNALTEYIPSNNRSQVEKTKRNTLIVDCYNANPTSMESAIESFDLIASPNKLLIIGDMLELGHISDDEHKKIILLLEKKQLKAILVGTEFYKQVSNYSTYKNTIELLANENLKELTDHYILLKGSRGIKLETLIEKL
jgi:UDP-N-acetylmuramoyl-tripeptide--D-alanyl-D-alanine ligase